MLIALVTGQRCRSLHLMDITSMQQNADHYKFIIKDIVKQSAPGRNQPELILPAFPADCRVYVYSVLSEYISVLHPLELGNPDSLSVLLSLTRKCLGTLYHVGLRML